jgi:hypothetical protein
LNPIIRWLLFAPFWLFSASAAWAHSSATGMAAFYEGALSVYTVPCTLIALVGFGLILALQKLTAERAWQAFAAGGLVGLGAVQLGLDIADPELPLMALGLLAGLFIASGVALPLTSALAGGAVLGFFFGVISAPHPGPVAAMVLTALGALISANVLLFYVAAVISFVIGKFQYAWLKIGLRVAGSWIAAISLIVLALDLSTPAIDETIESDTGSIAEDAAASAGQARWLRSNDRRLASPTR